MIRVLGLLLLASRLAAQAPSDVAMERAGYLAWLKTAPNSPLLAVAQQKVGNNGLSLGPGGADIPLPGVGEYRVSPANGSLVIEGADGKHTLARGRPLRIGEYSLYLTGPAPGFLTIFTNERTKKPPGYYDYDKRFVFVGPLLRSKSAREVRVLASDGMETLATEVGTVRVPLGGRTSLRVLRIPVAGSEESELEIFYRDSTNGRGSYPAGRFVSLIPAGRNTFRLDFNRSRNPYCAYSAVYACPLPWEGNVIKQSVPVGERYTADEPEGSAARDSQ
jgi:Protein of unknown function (DUF1684)